MRKLLPPMFLVGLALLAVVIMSLSTRIGSPASEELMEISRQLEGKRNDGVVINLTMSVNTQEHLEKFPDDVREWESTYNFDTAGVQLNLRADAYILRSYHLKNQLSQPFFLLLLHSPITTSFHAPQICYTGEGYNIGPMKDDILQVKNTVIKAQDKQKSAEEKQRSVLDIIKPASDAVSIPINHLEIYKTDIRGNVIERQLVLFTYLHSLDFGSGEFSIVRVSTVIPNYGNYTDTETTLKEFMGNVFSHLIRAFEGNNQRVIAYVAGFGLTGYCILVLICLIPLAMICYPSIVWVRYSLNISMQNQEPETTTGEAPETTHLEGTTVHTEPETALNKTLNLPYDLSGKTGKEKIFGAYNNCLWAIDRVLRLPANANDTLRERMEKLSPSLPLEIAGDFRELTLLAEKVAFSEIGDDDPRIMQAVQLGENIIRHLEQNMP